MAHPSDSIAQHLAEQHALTALGSLWGANFRPDTRLAVELDVRPDGVDMDRKLVVEIYARIGALKAAQAHKVRADLFKLAYLRKLLGADWRAVLCFVDHEAAAFVLGGSWAAKAAASFGVEIVVQPIPENLRQEVIAAQARQRMTNAVI